MYSWVWNDKFFGIQYKMVVKKDINVKRTWSPVYGACPVEVNFDLLALVQNL